MRSLNQDDTHTVDHCFKQVRMSTFPCCTEHSATACNTFYICCVPETISRMRVFFSASPFGRHALQRLIHPSTYCIKRTCSYPAVSLSFCVLQGPRDDDACFLSSDCDEQLLINMKFKQPVRLHSISLKSLDMEKAPKKIKIFVNPVNMSFDSAVRPSAALRLLHWDPSLYQCKAVICLCWLN